MPAVSVFVDTNVLLYAFDARSPEKCARANAWLSFLWQEETGKLSWQVLNEFYATAIRKAGLDHNAARRVVRVFSRWQPVPPGMGQMERAWYWTDQAGLPYWDALIVAAAEQLGCSRLLTEDFQHGQRFGTVEIVNPFLEPPLLPA